MKKSKLTSLAATLVFAFLASNASAYTLLYDDYFVGTSGIPVSARQDPNNALHTDGTNDDTASTISAVDFTSLGRGGSIVLYLANKEAIANVDGDDDFTVFETTGRADETGYNPLTYPEYADIYAFTSGIYDASATYTDAAWTYLGNILQNGSLDLRTLLSTTAIKIVDTTTYSVSDGFDVYGLGINKVTSTPVPAAIWMLGTGVIAATVLRRKKVL